MGCNSHLVIETAYRYSNNENKPVVHWNTWAAGIPESRDYVMYGLMAQVRQQFEESHEARGVPADCDSDTKVFLQLEDEDGKPIPPDHRDFHSHSWLSVMEFVRVLHDYESILKREGVDDWSLAKEWQALTEVLIVLSKHYGHHNVRLVFAFDN